MSNFCWWHKYVLHIQVISYNIDYQTYTNNADVADQFDKHFINAGSLLASEIEKLQHNQG